jgi:acyl-CoA thioesterase FadM
VHFYSAPWEVVEGDVAGCGPRLFLTGTKLLSGVWDRLVTEARQGAFTAVDQLDSVTWIVLEQGIRVLAPVALRERLVCLLSLDELADSSRLRLYFRVMRSNGEPVACAFMAVACAQKVSGGSAALPQPVLELLESRGGFRERSPSFVERALVLPGAEESLLPDDVRALAIGIAMQSAVSVTQRRTPTTPLAIPALGELPVPEGRTAFFFPDAPSYDGRLLCELRAYLPYLADYFDQAEEVSRRVFRQSFLPLVDMDAIALHDQRLERCPELAHVGVVLTGVLIAESLKEHCIKPATGWASWRLWPSPAHPTCRQRFVSRRSVRWLRDRRTATANPRRRRSSSRQRSRKFDSSHRGFRSSRCDREGCSPIVPRTGTVR